MDLTLTTLDTSHGAPDDRKIAEVLATLDGGRHILATLAESELSYVQASGSVQKGFSLDYQEGSLDRHYRSRAEDLPLDRIVRAFQRYSHGDETWREGFDWVHMPHVPQRTPWFSTWIGYLIVLGIVIALIWIWRG
ncbi:MAG TPA: hypothetical protein VEL75_05630 [Candidatus Methylomirabilis sp.]|nr:hypothetical protein [Candidatus Methylomirabilis sp.]